jgi:phosphatidylglycerophosphatase A
VIAIGDSPPAPHPPPPGGQGTRELTLSDPAWLIATWFGAGLLPLAPGTWGSLVALPFAWGIELLGGALGLVIAASVLFFAGWWAAERVTRASGVADDARVVVDEVAGLWLTLAAAPFNLPDSLLAFLLFRVFDIVKPWPVSWADRNIAGGLGVMADDILAAGYAGATLLLLRLLGRLFLA